MLSQSKYFNYELINIITIIYLITIGMYTSLVNDVFAILENYN